MMTSTESPVSARLMRVVFDSNVLISAAVTAGIQASYALHLVAERKLISITSSEIIREVEEKLRTKFHYELDEITKFSDYFQQLSTIVQPVSINPQIIRDPNDLFVLGTAVSGEANLIITTDRDLLTLGQYDKIGIIHPKMLQWMFPKR